MILFDKKENCCGCTACKHACPEQCIEMIADEKGFLYPRNEKDRCTNCGICVKVCPLKGASFRGNRNYNTPKVYAAKHKDDRVRMDSSSGGAFTAISDYFLDNSGVVYGAAFNDVFKVYHIKAHTKAERNKLRGSKYVQSDLGDVFKEVESDLKDSKQVLFTGTPCQTAGLHSYLGKEYDKLYCCDLVCHGVSSPQIFAEYLNCVSNDEFKLKDIKFRDKISGWHSSSFAFVTGNGKKNSLLMNNPFCHLYFGRLIMRPACHACMFASFNRPSDITLADFWGIENVKPGFDDNKGVSLVIISNDKGKAMFSRIQSSLLWIESSIDECMQPNLKEPSKPARNVEAFWKDYANRGFEYIIAKYTPHGLFYRCKNRLYKRLSKIRLLKLFWNIYKSFKYVE